jgi:hypothetical protein
MPEVPVIGQQAKPPQTPAQQIKAHLEDLRAKQVKFEEGAAEFRAGLLTPELQAEWDELLPLIRDNGRLEIELCEATGAMIGDNSELRGKILMDMVAEFLFDKENEDGQKREIEAVRRYHKMVNAQIADAIPQVEQFKSQQRMAALARADMSPEEMVAFLQQQGMPVQSVKMIPKGLRKGPNG